MSNTYTGMGYGYKGNMHIQCWKCGAQRSFYTRQETEVFYCKECGYRTGLEKLSVAYVRCECETFNKYYTNVARPFEVECRGCGQPVAMYQRKSKGKMPVWVSAFDMEERATKLKKSAKGGK